MRQKDGVPVSPCVIPAKKIKLMLNRMKINEQASRQFHQIFLILLIFFMMLVGACSFTKLFSMRIGKPNEKIFVEAKEIERGKRHSIITVEFENIREWKSVGSSIFIMCSIREFVKCRGYNWFATVDGYGARGRILVILLESKEEKPKEVFSVDEKIIKNKEIFISEINGYRSEYICKNIVKHAVINY